jgi:hypothetical protein
VEDDRGEYKHEKDDEKLDETATKLEVAWCGVSEVEEEGRMR